MHPPCIWHFHQYQPPNEFFIDLSFYKVLPEAKGSHLMSWLPSGWTQ